MKQSWASSLYLRRLNKIKQNLDFVLRALEVSWSQRGLWYVHLYVVHSVIHSFTHSFIMYWGPFSVGPGLLGSRDNVVNKHIPGLWSHLSG